MLCGTTVVVLPGSEVVVAGTVVVTGGAVVVVAGAVVVVVGLVVVVVGRVVVVVGCGHEPGRFTVAAPETFCGPGEGQLTTTLNVSEPVAVEGSVVEPFTVEPGSG